MMSSQQAAHSSLENAGLTVQETEQISQTEDNVNPNGLRRRPLSKRILDRKANGDELTKEVVPGSAKLQSGDKRQRKAKKIQDKQSEKDRDRSKCESTAPSKSKDNWRKREATECQKTISPVNEQEAKRYWSQLDRQYFQRLKPNAWDNLLHTLQQMPANSQFYQTHFSKKSEIACMKDSLMDELDINTAEESNYIVTMVRGAHNAYLVYYSISQGGGSQAADNKDMGAHCDSTSPSFKQGVDIQPELVNAEVISIDSKNNEFCRYVQIWLSRLYDTELDREAALMESHLLEVAEQNQNSVEQLKKNMLSKQHDPAQISDAREIACIKQSLLWSSTLKLFKQGFTDKLESLFDVYHHSQNSQKPFTLETLSEYFKKLRSCSGGKALSKTHQQKFQTDCKICFCSSNHQNNKVLYCDMCNTSYHQYCYGLDAIPKSDKYFCDACAEQKKDPGAAKPWCQICDKPGFPMKNLNGNFYHVTCLVLNNLGINPPFIQK